MSAVPFNRPVVLESATRYVTESLTSGHLSGDGPFTHKCHALMERTLGVPKVLLTTSCTHALEMSALLLDIQPGDEVIVPSFTFVSTVNAFVLRGARPVFADIRPDTLNMDEDRLESLITPKTRAIIPVHYAGVACEMNAINELAQKHGLVVVEDNAHGLFGRYHGSLLGTFGALATLSFHETKNFSCGEGGALLINDLQYAERADILREKGTNRSRFFRGQVDKYSWVDLGSSYLPSDALAALLLAQLEVHEQIQARRRALWHRYAVELGGWAVQHGARLPVVPAHCEHPAHLFYLLLPSLSERQQLIAHLKSRGISAVFHYLPLHLSEMGRRFGRRQCDCHVTETVSDRLLRLPLYYNMSDAEQSRVIEGVRAFQLYRLAA